jgi:Periplasmic component of the Tol biopolymer transport system
VHRKNRCLPGFLLVCGLLIHTGAWSYEFIIEKGVENPIPIAIVPFSWSQAASLPPVDIATIVSDDLTRSGRFSSMDQKDMPQQPHDINEINFKDWQRLGMENLVIGQLKQTDTGDYLADFRLMDVYKGKQLVGFSIPSTKLQLRRTAHEISDLIYEKLIGVRGAFATRIVYITVVKDKTGAKKYSLQVSDADGFNPQILLESKEPLLSPSWSPDGKKLAYVSFESKNSTVYIQDLLTARARKWHPIPASTARPPGPRTAAVWR